MVGAREKIKLYFSNGQILVRGQEIKLFEIRPKVNDHNRMEFGFL